MGQKILIRFNHSQNQFTNNLDKLHAKINNILPLSFHECCPNHNH